MSPSGNGSKDEAVSRKSWTGAWRWLRERVVPVLTLLFILGLTIGIFVYTRYNPERIREFENLGYLGAFLISLVANATIILPMPGLLVLIGLGTIFNPILVALVGAAGGALGELSGYVAGRSGRGLARGERKIFPRAERWMRKAGFLTVFLFSLLPFLPLDVAGLVAGVLRYPAWRFLIACFLGKGVLYIVMLYTGAWGWDLITRIFG